MTNIAKMSRLKKCKKNAKKSFLYHNLRVFQTILYIMVSKAELKSEVDFVKKEYQSHFWKKLYKEIIERHFYFWDFYLNESNLSYEHVLKHFVNSFAFLENERRFKFSADKNSFKFEIGMGRSTKKYGNMITVVVSKKKITLRFLPYNYLCKVFPLDDYGVVESIIWDYYRELIEKEGLKKFLEEFRSFENEFKILTPKTLEIAQDTIAALYRKSNQKEYYLEQSVLFSVMRVNGNNLSIMHKDFLKNPTPFIKMLQRESNL